MGIANNAHFLNNQLGSRSEYLMEKSSSRRSSSVIAPFGPETTTPLESVDPTVAPVVLSSIFD